MPRISKKTGLIIVVIAIALLSELVVFLNNIAIGAPVSSMIAWVGAFVVIVLIAVLSLFQKRLESAPETSATTALEKRQNMLNLVQKRITDFLGNPLYRNFEEQLLPLPLRERVGSRFDLELSNPLESTHPIPLGTTITQVFDEAGGELLILGKPGAGKTTLLLELAHDLLKRAKDNEEALIPVVLTLSWISTKVSLEQWIVKELQRQYDIPSQIGKEWVKANQLLLLLDGLDEVAPDVLPACIDTINDYYHQTHGSLVVCSRTKEFLKQSRRLALHTAVIVQPLSSEQVDTYLDGLTAKGEDVEGLKHALYQSEAFRRLTTNPLFLTVLILAYLGRPVQELLALVKVAPREQSYLLFHNYVERMLLRKGKRIHAQAQQVKHWLGWLARQMAQRSQTEFYIERMQPDWLPDTLSRVAYHVVLCLIFVPICGLATWLVVMPIIDHTTALGYGVIGGLFGLSVGLRKKIEPVEVIAWSWPWQGIHKHAWSWREEFKQLNSGLNILIDVAGLAVALVLGLLLYPLGWMVGVLIGLLDFWLEDVFGQIGLVISLLLSLLTIVLISGLILWLFSGLSRDMLNTKQLDMPNRGIWRSAKHGLVGVLIGGLLGMLVLGLHNGLLGGLLGGLALGLVLGLSLGGEAFIQHFTLRYFLWQARYTSPPWRYVAFLDDAVGQLLLRKVGGGFIFRHRLLQDYFAVISSHDPSLGAEAHSVLHNASNGDPSL